MRPHNRFLRELAKKLPDWHFEQTSRHVKIYNPDGAFVYTTSSTPSDWRAGRNLVAHLRRLGAKL
jgi:hypothetical protein